MAIDKDLRDIEIAQLAFIGGSIAALGDGIAALAAGLALDALKQDYKTKKIVVLLLLNQLRINLIILLTS